MEKPKLIFLGGGGHAISCWDVAQSSQIWDILGYTDLEPREMPIPYLGKDEDVFSLIAQDKTFFFLGVGHLGNPGLRHRLVEELNRRHAKWATLVSPFAYVSAHAQLGEGAIIHHKVVLNAGSVVEEHAIINTGATLEHGSVVGQHTHVSTHAVLNGEVHVGANCFIGSGCICFQQISIAADTTVGAGSVVRRSIPTSGVYAGNPLRKFA